MKTAIKVIVVTMKFGCVNGVYSGSAHVGGVVRVSFSTVVYQLEVDVPDGVCELQRQEVRGKHVINVKEARPKCSSTQVTNYIG